MATPRIYHPHAMRVDSDVTLAESAHHHLAHVLRAKPGAAVCLFDGSGHECTGSVVAVSKHNTQIRLHSCANVDRESPLHITLAQGVSRGDRMDLALQKCVELGVHAIVPIIAERTNLTQKKQLLEKRHAHWQAVVESAMAQSGRTRAVTVARPVAFGDWLGQLRPETKLILDPAASTSCSAIARTSACTLLVGPEGGFSSVEISAAIAADYQAVAFGPRILRTETAAIAAVAVLQNLWGDLR